MGAQKRKAATSSSQVKQSAATATINAAAAADTGFQRGGASALTPLEHREISNQVASDLFNNKVMAVFLICFDSTVLIIRSVCRSG